MLEGSAFGSADFSLSGGAFWGVSCASGTAIKLRHDRIVDLFPASISFGVNQRGVKVVALFMRFGHSRKAIAKLGYSFGSPAFEVSIEPSSEGRFFFHGGGAVYMS